MEVIETLADLAGHGLDDGSGKPSVVVPLDAGEEVRAENFERHANVRAVGAGMGEFV